MKTVAPFQNGERIVCLGDSITQDGAWLYFLTQYALVHMGRRVDFIDAGISGGCTDGALQRLDFDVIDRRPSRVLVMLGMNDVRRQLYCTETPDDRLAAERREALDLFRERIRQVIERLVAEKIEVVLLTTFPFDQYRPGLVPVRDSICCNSEGLSRLNDILRNLAEEYGLSLIDIFTPLTELYRQHPEFRFAEDRVHPKRFGHLLAAALIVETVYGRTSMGELFLSPDQVRCGTVEASGVEFSSTGMRFVCRFRAMKTTGWRHASATLIRCSIMKSGKSRGCRNSGISCGRAGSIAAVSTLRSWKRESTAPCCRRRPWRRPKTYPRWSRRCGMLGSVSGRSSSLN